MKMKNKGKVHPFATSSSFPPQNNEKDKDIFSALKLLPAAIFALISVLSFQEREVVAYMITRSLNSTNPSSFSTQFIKKGSKNQSFHTSPPALFDCDCFDCYTSFWFRWDSSPNRELINQAIEAFDDHLNNGEHFRIIGNGKTKRKEKIGRRKSESIGGVDFPLVKKESSVFHLEPKVVGLEEESAAVVPVVVVHSHMDLARKILPDVIGILNSRWWSLWSPNV